jgi:hypothetical protein
MTAKWATGASIALALGVASQSAHAQAATAQAALDYRPGPGCPDEAAFRGRIDARAPVTFDPGSSRSLSVTLDEGNPSRGRLQLTTDGAPVVREVSGGSCDEVASALALIAAVLLEQGANPDEPAVPLPPPPAGSPEAPVAAPPPASAPASPAPPPVPPAEAGASGSPVRIGWAVGAQALLGGGIGPSVAGGVRVFGEASIDVAAHPALRLSASWYPGTELESSLGAIRFSLLAGRLEACPVRLALGAFTLSPCGALDVGSIAAEASAPEARLWLAPGVIGRLAWFPGRIVGVEVQGGITFPLDHYRFFFSPEPVVYEVPAVAGEGGLGLVVRFP